MTQLPFLALAAAGVVLCLALRRRPSIVQAVACAGLLLCAGAALLIAPQDGLWIGEARLVATPFLILWLGTASVSLLLLHLLSMATAWQRNLPVAMYAGLAAMAVALALTDHGSALLIAASGGLLALATTILLPASMSELRLAGDALRLTAASAALALLGASWATAGGPRPASTVLAVAYLLVVSALVQRMGAMPLHITNVQTVRTAPLAGVPLLVAWLPAAFAAVALSWHQFAVLPLQPELGPARDLTLVIGLATVILAGVAAVIQEDLASLVGYSVAQDGALVLLALAQPEPTGSTAIRAWLLLFALAKTAAAGFVLAISTREGTRRLPELAGWARRSPLLAAALVLILLATYGLPGLLPFEVRAELIGLSLPGPLGLAIMLVSLLPAVGFGRLLLIGLRGAGVTEVVGPRSWRSWVSLPERDPLPSSSFNEEYEDQGAIYRERLRRAARSAVREVRYLPRLWAANQAAAAAVLVLLLALLPAALALGVGDLRGAAAGPPPIVAGTATGP